VNWSFTDADDVESYEAPLYQVVCAFSADAPSVVTTTIQPIEGVTVAVTAI
jgi:hypothetical protein